MIKLHDMPELAIPEADILQGEKRYFIAIYRLDLALPAETTPAQTKRKSMVNMFFIVKYPGLIYV